MNTYKKFIFIFLLIPSASIALKPMTDDEIKNYIIQRDVSIGRCACPYQLDRNNNKCGEKSAYFLNSEAFKPKCYPEDVKSYDIDDFRSKYDIEKYNYDQKRNYNQ